MIETQEQFEKLRANLKAGVYADRPEVQAGLLKQAQEFKANHPQPSPEPQTAAQKNPAEFDPLSPEFKGGPFSDFLRGGGLAFRTLLEGPTKPITAGADLLAGATNALLSTPDRVGPSGQGAAEASLALAGLPGTPDVPPQPLGVPSSTQRITEGFDRFLPSPETASERVIADTGDALIGATTGIGLAQQFAKGVATNPTTGNLIAKILADNPGLQTVAAASAGGASSTARESGASPLEQTGIGLAAGLLTPTVPQLLGKGLLNAGKGLLGILDSFTQSGQRKIAGNLLRGQSSNPTRAVEQLGRKTLTDQATGATSKDPGLLTLERTMRNTDPTGRFGAQQSTANLERQKILDVLGGDDVAAAKAVRDASTGAQRKAAFEGASDLDSGSVIGVIDRILASPEGARKTVRTALESFRKEIDGITNPRVLYEIRKDINLAMQGKFRNAERADFQLAKKELKQVKNAIDDSIESVAPGFKQYLDDYARLSKDIDRREIIQNIQERSALAASDASTGREFLSQAKFKRLVNAERKAGNLTDEQLNVLDAIAADLDLGQAINSATIRPTGSDTFKNITVAHIVGRTFGGRQDGPVINTLARPLRWLTRVPEDQVQQMVVDAMLDPKFAQQLLREATPANIATVSRTFRNLVGASGVGVAESSIPGLRGSLLDSPVPR